jgi:16S rRNA (cytosine967-C5)-methyltransferase
VTSPARIAAFHALRTLDGGSADLPASLARTRQHLQDDRDRALSADIVSGTIRWQRSLDHVLVHFARRPLQKLDREVVIILRLSLYQLLHLDRVPASAVVDDAVDLTRAARKPSATGFVNAVLRSTLRQRTRLPLPPRPADVRDRQAALAYLGITHSHPDWLVSRWLDRYGFEAVERWVQFNNDTPRLTIRVNRLRGSREEIAAWLEAEGVETEPTAHAPDGLTVVSGNPLRVVAEGRFVVQDEASQLVPLVVGARPGERVLDLCASPGGKTTAMVSDMGDRGLVVACDVRPRRIALLRDTVRTSAAKQVNVVHVGTDGHVPFGAVFDRVLVDAPCSGLGTVRRDPDIRWRRIEAELPTLARAQTILLSRAADVVGPSGRLVYATCSSEPEENEQVVDAFLASRRDFQLVDLRGGSHPALAPLLDDRGMLRTLPFRDRLEAFFAAALVRR